MKCTGYTLPISIQPDEITDIYDQHIPAAEAPETRPAPPNSEDIGYRARKNQWRRRNKGQYKPEEEKKLRGRAIDRARPQVVGDMRVTNLPHQVPAWQGVSDAHYKSPRPQLKGTAAERIQMLLRSGYRLVKAYR